MPYLFEGLRLDPARRRVQSVATAESLAVTPKAMDALIHLVEHRDRIVDKEELIRALWPRTVVEENSLDRCISTLRRALGESAGDNRFIATVPGRGYRFVAAVSEREPAEPAVQNLPASQEPWLRSALRHPRVLPAAAAAIGLAALAAILWFGFAKSRAITEVAPRAVTLAVQPLENPTMDAANARLTGGLSEELRVQLARIPGLRVLSPAAAISSATHRLEVSLGQSADRVRIRMRLSDARSGYQLWARSFDRRLDNVLELQDEVAATVVQALFPGVQAIGAATGPSTGSPHSVEAYRLYLEASSMVGASPENLRSAIELYGKSLALDPGFAPAWAARASTRTMLVPFDTATRALLDEAEADVTQALELDPNLASALAVRARLQGMRGQIRASAESFRRALSLQPNDAAILDSYGVFLALTGRLQGAQQQAQKAYDLAPLAPTAVMHRALFRTLAGEDQPALEDLAFGSSFGGVSNIGAAPDIRANAAFRAGRFAEAARVQIDSLPGPAKARGLDRVITLVYEAQATPDRRPSARTALRTFLANNPVATLDRRSASLLMLMMVLSEDVDGALDLMETLVDEELQTGVPRHHGMQLWTPEMRRLRQDPRFGELMARVGDLVDYWRQEGAPDGCRLEERQLRCG